MKEIRLILPKTETSLPEVLMHGKNRNGDEVAVNRKYFTQNGLPWFPITGEFHFSRFPSEYWKEELQKIKAGGLDTVATYVFWIHHEEMEGRFRWDGRYDLKRFITLCGEVGLKVILRIGPWDHGEVRNGGYPDWLFQKTKAPGTNDPEYFKYSRKLYAEIYNQVKTLLYKDNGPIIGIQIDNEYGHCHGLGGDEGREHMLTLKKMAMETGFDVPLYTATGWGGAVVVEGELLPVMAAYVEGAWEQHIDKVPPNINFVFTSVRDDLSVGSDLAATRFHESTYNMERYPFATCELGGGMQSCYQRRPIITADDTEAMAFVKLGSGAVMLGYYMYQGGTNPVGELSTFQESRATGFPNDLPRLSYDYQAPLGEYGQSNPSYHALRRLHLFARSQEAILTKSSCYIPQDKEIRPDDPSALRCAVRYLGDTGFLFVNTYQHNLEMEPQENLNFSVAVEGEIIAFPEISLRPGQWRMLPFNQRLGGVTLKCATMQPLTSLAHQGEEYYFYYGEPGQQIEYHFDRKTVKKVVSGDVKAEDALQMAIGQEFGDGNSILDPIILENAQGSRIHIVTLTKQQASRFNLYELNGETYAMISEMDLFVDDQQIQGVSAGKPKAAVLAFPQLLDDQKLHAYAVKEKISIFSQYQLEWTAVEPKVTIEEKGMSAEGHMQYRISAEHDFMSGCGDVFLDIDFEGDIAEITRNGELMADCFYSGLTWRIGLKRFSQLLGSGEWILDISPLYRDAYVYLDKWPEMKDGKALKLVQYSVVPEYRIFQEEQMMA
jgi:hypothetical protein